MNCQHSQFLYADTPVPRLSAQPFQVYSTPGLGNFFNDHFLYTPLRHFGDNIKEIEKHLESSGSGEGGFELNSPLITQPLVPSLKKTSKKKIIKKNRSEQTQVKSTQKGHGKNKMATDPEIDEALQHPIKVFCKQQMF